MQRFGAHGERLFTLMMCDAQSIPPHRLDMLRPPIDEGYVFTSADHMSAGVAADRTGADDRNFLARNFLAHCFCSLMRHLFSRFCAVSVAPELHPAPAGRPNIVATACAI